MPSCSAYTACTACLTCSAGTSCAPSPVEDSKEAEVAVDGEDAEEVANGDAAGAGVDGEDGDGQRDEDFPYWGRPDDYSWDQSAVGEVDDWKWKYDGLNAATACGKLLHGHGRASWYPDMEQELYSRGIQARTKGLAVNVGCLQKWSHDVMKELQPRCKVEGISPLV
ncbi:unnamed protein product [Closterium sp. NIES-53]